MHRDKPRTSEGKRETAQGKNGVQGEPKSEDKTRGEPTTDDLERPSEPPKKKTKMFSSKEQERGGKGKRTRPGAALALAQREKVAIVPSSGKKTVF